MKFSDSVIIFVNAGNGGNGCVSFKKINKFKNYPNGGCGGNGGNVYLISDKSIYCLNKLNNNSVFYAQNGFDGRKNNCSGKCGKDLYIKVPIGTCIYNYNTKEKIHEFIYNNQEILIAKGGFRGLGSIRINKIPKKNFIKDKNLGKKGENLKIELKLNLISDVGIFGITNSGKSYIFKSMTKIDNVKISNYQFTTKFPKIGFVNLNKYNFFSLLDTPGFIFNFNNFYFKNIKFLNHLNKCKLLLHIIDITLFYNYKYLYIIKYINSIYKELKLNNIDIKNKEIWIIINNLYFNDIYNFNNKIYSFFKKNNLKIKYYILTPLKYNLIINDICNDIYNYLLI